MFSWNENNFWGYIKCMQLKEAKEGIRFLCLFVGFNERSTENCAVEAVSDDALGQLQRASLIIMVNNN